MEDNNIITLYKNKIQNISMLVIAILFIIGIVAMLLFTTPEVEVIIVMIFPVILGWAFYEVNRLNKNRLFVKENGRVYSGNVLHVKVTKSNKTTIRRLLIEFFDGNEKRLIVSEHFPYYIDKVSLDLVSVMNKTADMEEYNRCYKENIIEHMQYYGNGYISFDRTEQTKYIYKYKSSRNKNYEGDLTCKVYEYEGKYVVDDFEGYSDEGTKKVHEKAKKIVRIWLIMMIIIMVMLYKGYFGN